MKASPPAAAQPKTSYVDMTGSPPPPSPPLRDISNVTGHNRSLTSRPGGGSPGSSESNSYTASDEKVPSGLDDGADEADRDGSRGATRPAEGGGDAAAAASFEDRDFGKLVRQLRLSGEGSLNEMLNDYYEQNGEYPIDKDIDFAIVQIRGNGGDGGRNDSSDGTEGGPSSSTVAVAGTAAPAAATPPTNAATEEAASTKAAAAFFGRPRTVNETLEKYRNNGGKVSRKLSEAAIARAIGRNIDRRGHAPTPEQFEVIGQILENGGDGGRNDLSDGTKLNPSSSSPSSSSSVQQNVPVENRASLVEAEAASKRLQTELEQVKSDRLLQESKVAKLRDTLKAKEVEIEALCEELRSTKQTATELERNVQSNADAFEVKKAELLKRIRTLDEELRSMKEKLRLSQETTRAMEQNHAVVLSELALRKSELEKAREDCEAAVTRAASKDRDMSELMKGLGDIQRSGQEREADANAAKRNAEEKAAELERQLLEARGKIAMLSHEKSALKESLDSARSDLLVAEADIWEQKSEKSSQASQLQVEKELRSRAEDKEQEERRERNALSAQMVAMAQEHARVEAQLKEANEGLERQWKEKLEAQVDVCKQKEVELRSAKETLAGSEGERSTLKKALNDQKNLADAKKVEEIGRLNGEIMVLKERLKDEKRKARSFGIASAEQVQELEEKLRKGQDERRKQHNIIQELRGNVRVFVRVRPFLPDDGVKEDAQPFVTAMSDTNLKVVKSAVTNREHNFSFDRVFSPIIGQEAVFQEVSEFVQSALDGYNVCLFSYGQTGSGKTHTMQGSGVGQMRGIIPRAIEQIGLYKKSLERDGWQYDMKVSFLEMYQDTIRDLLRDGKSEAVKHEIKVNSEGRRYITDLTMKELEPTDTEAVENVMRQAAKHRSVASTDMNAVSSRSHSVFTLHLTAKHFAQRQSLRGTLNLVDLAGSERLERSGATGERAKEAMAINKSLSSLTDVFVAIGKKASHIPFRNSKLTYLLQPSLSEDGKALMMVNLSPTEMSVQESLCSLRFAAQVNKCELGKPKRSIEEVTTDDECCSKGNNSKKPASGNRRTGNPMRPFDKS